MRACVCASACARVSVCVLLVFFVSLVWFGFFSFLFVCVVLLCFDSNHRLMLKGRKPECPENMPDGST